MVYAEKNKMRKIRIKFNRKRRRVSANKKFGRKDKYAGIYAMNFE
jgi:hypothetical protein